MTKTDSKKPTQILGNQPEIETEIRNFYEQLYAPRETASSKARRIFAILWEMALRY